MCFLTLPKEKKTEHIPLERNYQKTSWKTYFQIAQENMIKVSTIAVAVGPLPSFSE